MDLDKNSSSGAAVSALLQQHSSRATELCQWLADKIISNQEYEASKIANYHLSIGNSIPIPVSTAFASTAELAQLLKTFPCVVKFNTANITGIQTVVVNSTTDFRTVIESSKHTNSTQGIVQQFVAGQEYTVLALVGKSNWVQLGTAVDYKTQLDNNQGLNTFGMGSTSPCNYVAAETDQIVDQVVQLLQDKHGFTGPLACQFLLEPTGKLWLLEWNTRFCDPETQSIFECLDHTAAQAIEQMVDGKHITQPTIHNQNAVTVVLAHQDWPTRQPTREEITLEETAFKIYKCHGNWSQNLYWGSLTNSGSKPHTELASEIYSFLAAQNIAPYRYRTDIAKQ